MYFPPNDDNAKLVYLGAVPNTNPIYIDLVASARHDCPANNINWHHEFPYDPRRPFYFTQVDTSTQAGVVKLAYVGGINGASNDFLAYSHVANLIQTPTFPGTLFDYAEVEFLLAEAVERGYTVGGTAAQHYNNAITASIEDWGGYCINGRQITWPIQRLLYNSCRDMETEDWNTELAWLL